MINLKEIDYQCKICHREYNYMDMHSRDLCKNCWVSIINKEWTRDHETEMELDYFPYGGDGRER